MSKRLKAAPTRSTQKQECYLCGKVMIPLKWFKDPASGLPYLFISKDGGKRFVHVTCANRMKPEPNELGDDKPYVPGDEAGVKGPEFYEAEKKKKRLKLV